MIRETVILSKWRLHILLLIQSFVVQCLCSRPVTLRPADLLVITTTITAVGTVAWVARVDRVARVSHRLVVFIRLEDRGQSGIRPASLCGNSGDEGHLIRIKL